MTTSPAGIRTILFFAFCSRFAAGEDEGEAIAWSTFLAFSELLPRKTVWIRLGVFLSADEAGEAEVEGGEATMAAGAFSLVLEEEEGLVAADASCFGEPGFSSLTTTLLGVTSPSWDLLRLAEPGSSLAVSALPVSSLAPGGAATFLASSEAGGATTAFLLTGAKGRRICLSFLPPPAPADEDDPLAPELLGSSLSPVRSTTAGDPGEAMADAAEEQGAAGRSAVAAVDEVDSEAAGVAFGGIGAVGQGCRGTSGAFSCTPA